MTTAICSEMVQLKSIFSTSKYDKRTDVLNETYQIFIIYITCLYCRIKTPQEKRINGTVRFFLLQNFAVDSAELVGTYRGCADVYFTVCLIYTVAMTPPARSYNRVLGHAVIKILKNIFF